jgi:hypothetical protein
MRPAFNWLIIGPNGDNSVGRNKASISMKYGEFLEMLSDFQLLKPDFGVTKTNIYGTVYIEITSSALEITSSCSTFQAVFQHTYRARSNDLQCAAVTAVTNNCIAI